MNIPRPGAGSYDQKSLMNVNLKKQFVQYQHLSCNYSRQRNGVHLPIHVGVACVNLRSKKKWDKYCRQHFYIENTLCIRSGKTTLGSHSTDILSNG